MSWEHDETFLRKRIQEQKDHIAKIKECKLDIVRELFVLESAEGQLTYFELKLNKLNSLLSQIQHINAGQNFMRNPENVEMMIKLVEGVNRLHTEKTMEIHGWTKCGDCNKFYRCTTCDEPCSEQGHYIQ